MSTDKNQSSIKETRDQLFLDYADGTRLNNVSSNLGINRPVFGFNDDEWRALVKETAVDYKQIATKFYDVLSVLYGPRITQVATLEKDVSAGDEIVYLNNTDDLPQVGTLVFDDDLTNREQKDYCFIDRTTNAVFLNEALDYSHIARTFDAEQPLLFVNNTQPKLILPNTLKFPTSNFPYPIVVGRGTDSEEVALVTGNDVDEHVLTLQASLVNTHEAVRPTMIKSSLGRAYAKSSVFLDLNDSTKFPEKGVALLGPVDSFTATGGTLRRVEVNAGTFTVDGQIGNIVRFNGDVTSALQNVEVGVVDNSGSRLIFFEELPAAPQSGDTFSIRPQVEFLSNNYDEGVINLRKQIVDLTIPVNTEVELMYVPETAALAPVKFEGTNWDVIQSSPNLVELLIPTLEDNKGALRSASYLHTTEDESPPSTTTSSSSSAGDDKLEVNSTVDFPIVGVVTIDFGGGNEENVGYYIADTALAEKASSGDTTIKVLDSSFFPDTGQVTINQGGSAETVSVSDNNKNTNTLTVSSLSNDHEVGVKVREANILHAATTEFGTHASGETVDLYQPAYSSSDLLIGDYNNKVDTFPGPYVYNVTQPAPTRTVNKTSLVNLLPGPTSVALEQEIHRTALEVEHAVAFDLVNFPYNALVGADTGNRERVTINDINLAQRVSETVATGVSAGVTEIEVSSLTSGAAGDGARLPSANGYRVRIGRGTSNDEVVFVEGTNTSPDRIILEDATTEPHNLGESVELISDVLTINSLIDVHRGRVSHDQRSTARAGQKAIFPVFSHLNITRSEAVNVELDEIQLQNTSGLDTEGGRVLFNFGPSSLPSSAGLSSGLLVGDTTLTVPDSSIFPTTYPYVIIIGKGTPWEEHVRVTLNDTATNTLTINGGSYGVKYSHNTGEVVYWTPGTEETILYSSISSGKLSFSTPIVLQSTHSPSETVIDSSKDSDPRESGYDFPLRIPPDSLTRLSFIIDLIRAAGVKVEVISQR